MSALSGGAWENRPIEPVASLGQNVLLKAQQKFTLYKINQMEQMPMGNAMVVDFGAIAANTTDRSNSLQTPLQMNGNEFGQFRHKILDPINLQWYEPQSQPRFVNTNAWPMISKKGQKVDPYDAATELFVWQDNWPYVDVQNNRDYALTTSRIAFYGFRYQIARLTDPTTGEDYPPFDFMTQVPNNVPYAGLLAEGFVGYAFQRSGLG